MVGVRFDSEDLARTGDIDFAGFESLSVALDDEVEVQPDTILRVLKFDAVPDVGTHQV
ncbi:GSU2403 family nucleotidyltransferase fold protein [Celeribacter naphthalenivorans]|uniref:GSU2403 family nucleotidyltransferase fold protein n=1 Tax=Celeribacter naphthalenivorans TaxID=1614694 RepID=UPI00299E687E|nr:GSU2403 family nucleotidyltransferase fold protein [Celeribacter naphthalenivorans]